MPGAEKLAGMSGIRDEQEVNGGFGERGLYKIWQVAG